MRTRDHVDADDFAHAAAGFGAGVGGGADGGDVALDRDRDQAAPDLVLVDGNPLDDINMLADPAGNFVVIMKGGRIYKNRLVGEAAKSSPSR